MTVDSNSPAQRLRVNKIPRGIEIELHRKNLSAAGVAFWTEMIAVRNSARLISQILI